MTWSTAVVCLCCCCHSACSLSTPFCATDIKSPYNGRFVNIGEDWGLKENNIWTIEIERQQSASRDDADADAEPLPIVLVHGFAAGVGMWSLNLDELAKDRKVYAFDLIGFGRSSRPQFDFSNPEEVEYSVVSSFERWRIGVGLNRKFILLGHSFGGYLALSYALAFPEHVAHLILAVSQSLSSRSHDLNHNRVSFAGSLGHAEPTDSNANEQHSYRNSDLGQTPGIGIV